MAKHKRLAASAAKRWLSCPGSIAFCEANGMESKESVYAAEGTAAHALAETAIAMEAKAEAFIGQEVEGFTVTEEMAEAVQVYLDFVEAVSSGGELSVEVKSEIGETGGTSDCVVWQKQSKALIVADYKHGKGVPVSPVKNPQLRIYACGALQKYPDAEDIRVVIVQPRAQGEAVKDEWMTRAHLERWRDNILLPGIEAVNKSRGDIKDLVAGEHCRWCPALAICPRQRQHAVEVAKTEFGVAPEFPKPETMAVDEIAKVLTFTEQLKTWANAVMVYAQEQMEAGKAIPGWKLVEKRALRKWKANTKEKVEEMLGDQAYKKSLVSPAEAEKILKKQGMAKEAIGDLWEKPEAGLTLAPESDRRKEVVLDKAGDFVEQLDMFG